MGDANGYWNCLCFFFWHSRTLRWLTINHNNGLRRNFALVFGSSMKRWKAWSARCFLSHSGCTFLPLFMCHISMGFFHSTWPLTTIPPGLSQPFETEPEQMTRFPSHSKFIKFYLTNKQKKKHEKLRRCRWQSVVLVIRMIAFVISTRSLTLWTLRNDNDGILCICRGCDRPFAHSTTKGILIKRKIVTFLANKWIVKLMRVNFVVAVLAREKFSHKNVDN